MQCALQCEVCCMQCAVQCEVCRMQCAVLSLVCAVAPVYIGWGIRPAQDSLQPQLHHEGSLAVLT